MVLEERGIEVPSEVRAVIDAEQSLDCLDSWMRRAVKVRTAREVIADE